MSVIPASVQDLGARLGNLVVLTGAGISAESGIPTFRGPEGYWTVGSRAYRPQEIATRSFFRAHPEDVWEWYLVRRSVCRAARPNAGHAVLVDFERRLGDRFRLVTQNVDGLHLAAGNSSERMYEIHGNIERARCSVACTAATWQLDLRLTPWHRGRIPTPEERALLRCPRCNSWARPHVLWFDEVYDEEHFRCASSLRAVEKAALLLVVGASGATSLPLEMAYAASAAGIPIVDVDPEPNPFAELAERGTPGGWMQSAACTALPVLAQAWTT